MEKGEVQGTQEPGTLDPKVVYGPVVGNRWVQLVAGVVAMIVISSSAKGVSSILAGYGAALVAAHYAGSFEVPYYVAAIFDITAAVLALFLLRPIVRRRIATELDARLAPARA